jgi:hypothetical protein
MAEVPRGARRFTTSSTRAPARSESFAMVPVLPLEMLSGAFELVCCFFTLLAAAFGCLLVRQ